LSPPRRREPSAPLAPPPPSAEPPQELRQLDPDRPAADHNDAGGDLLQGGGLAIGPGTGVVQSVGRRNDRIRSGAEQDALRGELLVADPEASRARQTPVALDDRDAHVVVALDPRG